MSFINKIVIVTGAGSGIGESIALHFAKSSARLCLIDKNAEGLKKCAEQCEKLSRAKVLTIAADLTKDDLVKKAVDDTLKEYGKIDVVVNCAGISYLSRILDADAMDIFDKIMSVNLRAVVNMTSCAAAALIETKGCFVNISSVSSVLPANGNFAYSVGKAALSHFTRCIAYDLASSGVRVNAILPGPVKTNIVVNAGVKKEVSDALFLGMESLLPLKHIVKAEEIAAMVAFLASDNARSITGASCPVDSGHMLLGTLNVAPK